MPSEDIKEFEIESIQDKESIVKYIQAIADGFLNGQMVIGTKKRQLVLLPQGLIKLKIKAKRKGNLSCKVVMKFSWNEGKDDGNF